LNLDERSFLNLDEIAFSNLDARSFLLRRAHALGRPSWRVVILILVRFRFLWSAHPAQRPWVSWNTRHKKATFSKDGIPHS